MVRGLGYAFGVFIGLPVIIFMVNFLFFRGNHVTPEQVKKYIDSSDIIEVFIPANSKDNYEVYYPKLTQGNNVKVIFRTVFYSKTHHNYLMLVTFKGFDFNGPFKTDRNRERLDYVGRGGYFLVRANQNQWNSSDYGTKENPVPVFGVEMIGTLNGKPKDMKSIMQEKKRFDIPDEINEIYVEQYLNHFLPEKEFKKLFGEG